ncbi:MAG: alcohol dehydrogenase catalytic domain-containing protein [Candidatus Eremiobacteraeota bacterium]|nr:alcohol dehydrogenase catalytic domain-containing protein [Candidatus Eremiobacteraeota bacterium]
MKAAVFDAPGRPLTVENIADPVAGDADLVVAISACGICGSDLHLADADGTRGMPPLPHGTVMGHEFSGTVVDAGRLVRAEWANGTRVTALPTLGCGRCAACLSGAGSRCAVGAAIGLGAAPGAYAEFVQVRALETMRVPENVTDREAATVEPLAVGLRAVRAAALERGDDVLVLGAGPIGLAVATWCRFFGARRVIVSDLVPARLATAESMGATDIVDASAQDVAMRIASIAPNGPRVVFECVGLPGMQQLAMTHSSQDGRVIIVGVCMEIDRIMPIQALMKELTVKYVLRYERADFSLALDMLAAGRITSTPMMSGSVGFDTFSKTFETMKTSKAECKVFLEPASR